MTPIDPVRSKRIVINMTRELATKIEDIAKKERRPIAQLCRNVLEDYVNAYK